MRLHVFNRSKVSAARRFRSSVQHQDDRDVTGDCQTQIVLFVMMMDVDDFADEADAQPFSGNHRGIF